MKKSLAAMVAAIVLTSGVAHAVPTSFVAPDGTTSPFEDWTLGNANSVHAQWEIFTDAVGTPGNLPDVAGSFPAAGTPSGAAAVVIGNTPSAFLTGGGNIYSFAAPTNFTVTVPNYGLGAGWNTRFVAQIQNQGSPLDFSSVLLSYDGGNQLLPFDYTGELAGNPAPENLFAWDVAGLNPSTFTLTFNASSSSMSLDALAIDTFTQTDAFNPLDVPEPTSFVLVGAALTAATALVRRRR
jgi:hypothetical protein